MAPGGIALAGGAGFAHDPPMPLLPEQNNFADLRESANKLLSATSDENLKRLTGIVGTLLYRCDLLEREVERLEREKK